MDFTASPLRSLRDRLRLRRFLPWRVSRLGGPLNTLLGVHLRRLLLRRRMRRVAETQPDGVTVVIAHRNRADYRIRNALRSIRGQSCRADIRILVVDYGSEPEQLERLRAITEPLGAEVLPIGDRAVWNKAHCLNLGIRRVSTKFVMTLDVDVILGSNYLAEALAALDRDPLTAVFAPCVYLPESCREDLEAGSRDGTHLDLDRLKGLGSVKPDGWLSTGMVVTYTRFFHEIRGYDEFYHTYGAEDSDLAQRFFNLGLRRVSIAPRTFYLHQWHEKFEGVLGERLQETIQRNVAYCQNTHSIRRNPAGWGELTIPPASSDRT